jgi:hypothetical protein
VGSVFQIGQSRGKLVLAHGQNISMLPNNKKVKKKVK